MRTGRYKPDLVAPGYRILAARSTPAGSETPLHQMRRNSGTSMAAPHVTGAGAAMMEERLNGFDFTGALAALREIAATTGLPLDEGGAY